jgi:hypothetical protein
MARPSSGYLAEFGFRVPYDPAVSERDMEQAAELWADYEQRAADERRRHDLQRLNAIRRWRAQIRELVGAENYHDLRQLKRRLHKEAYVNRKPPDGLGLRSEDLTRLNAERLHSFLAERGLLREAIHDRLSRRFDDLTVARPTHWDGTVHLAGHADVLGKSSAANPWTTFTPPFSGWQGGVGYGAVTSGFRTANTPLLNPAAGQVGSILTLDCDDASDFDVAAITADRQVAFWYQAPVTGLIEVVIRAVCGEARHTLNVEDEWGVSSFEVDQKSFLMMHVIHPNVREPQFQLVSELSASGDTSTYRTEQHIVPGQSVESRVLVSDGPVAAGEWVVIRAGSRSSDGARTNDMEIHSRTAFSWFLTRIHVHVRQ